MEALELHLAAYGQPQLDEDDAVAHKARLEERRLLEKLHCFCLGAEAEHPLDADPVVPRAIEYDHVAGRGKVLDLALEIPLAALGFGRLRQRYRRGHGADSNAA
jgi:hypothetical protein